MRVFILLYCICIGFNSIAQDSIQKKQKRFIIDATCGVSTGVKGRNGESKIKPIIDCSITNWSHYNLNLSYSFFNFRSSRGNLNALAFRVGGGFSTFVFHEYILDYGNSSGLSSTTHVFPAVTTKKTSNDLSASFSYMIMMEKLSIIQSIGVRYVFFQQKSQTNKYQEWIISSGTAFSQDSITSTNPNGMYDYYNTSYENHSDVIIFSNAVNPFYNIDLGIKAGNFLPHLGFEAMYSNNHISIIPDKTASVQNIKSTIMLKINFGLAFRF